MAQAISEERDMKHRFPHLTAAVFVHEQTLSKYVDVYTIGYGAELPDADADADPVAEADAAKVFDADDELEEEEDDEQARVVRQNQCL